MGMRIWLWKYTFLFMSGYGHDESAPTPGGVFRNPFRWCSQRYRNPFAMLLAIRQQHFGNPFAMFWQTVRSRRGRFIVPAYMKTPTK